MSSISTTQQSLSISISLEILLSISLVVIRFCGYKSANSIISLSLFKSYLIKDKLKENVIIPKEQDGPKGPEPTRYGDWEKAGRCSDF